MSISARMCGISLVASWPLLYGKATPCKNLFEFKTGVARSFTVSRKHKSSISATIKPKVHISTPLHNYILAHTSEPEVLRRLREETSSIAGSSMQITADQAQLLSFLVRLTGAKRCIEVGVFAGYSAISVAMALPEDGILVALDRVEHTMVLAKQYAELAGVQKKVDFRLGQANDSLTAMLENGESESYDFGFIDADKRSYGGYYELLLQLIKPGGLIVVDNVLWHGDVADPEVTDKKTESLRIFNDFVANDSRVSTSMVPVGDGMTLCQKR